MKVVYQAYSDPRSAEAIRILSELTTRLKAQLNKEVADAA